MVRRRGPSARQKKGREGETFLWVSRHQQLLNRLHRAPTIPLPCTRKPVGPSQVAPQPPPPTGASAALTSPMRPALPTLRRHARRQHGQRAARRAEVHAVPLARRGQRPGAPDVRAPRCERCVRAGKQRRGAGAAGGWEAGVTVSVHSACGVAPQVCAPACWRRPRNAPPNPTPSPPCPHCQGVTVA